MLDDAHSGTCILWTSMHTQDDVVPRGVRHEARRGVVDAAVAELLQQLPKARRDELETRVPDTTGDSSQRFNPCD